MRKVEAYVATDNSLHKTKEDCAAKELVILIDNNHGDLNEIEAACIVKHRKRVIEILNEVDVK